jgi:hypothetical protein
LKLRFRRCHYRKGFAYFRDEKLAEAIQEWKLVYNMDLECKDADNNLRKTRKLLESLEAIKRS